MRATVHFDKLSWHLHENPHQARPLYPCRKQVDKGKSLVQSIQLDSFEPDGGGSSVPERLMATNPRALCNTLIAPPHILSLFEPFVYHVYHCL